MIHLREPTLEDVLSVVRDAPADEKELWSGMSGRPFVDEDIADMIFGAAGKSYVIHNGEKPLAAAGFSPRCDGVYRTWMLATPATWDPHGREVTRVVREQIRLMLCKGIANRIETVTLADRNRARDWYPKIGLQFESTLRKYTPNGADAVIYVATRGAEAG